MTPRVVLVTGSSGGIGSAICDAFAASGDTVIEIDLDRGCDVTDPGACERVVHDTVTTHDRIDVVCNNAGVGAVGDIVTATAADWQRVWAVNVMGVVNLSAAAIPVMREQRAGAIVNTCSVAADIGLRDRVAYSASKGAVLALTRAMAADEIDYGIRVNCVSPTTVDGPWVRRLIEASDDPESTMSNLQGRQPMGVLATASQVAAAVHYLASDAAAVTGSELRVDAGATTVLNQP